MTKEIIGGRYEIQARLGRGGMATVYRALDTRLKRDIAIKVVRTPSGTIDSGFYFLREARSAAALRHNNIVQIYDYSGPDESPIFLVMELVEGRTLDDIIHERESLSDELAICVTRAIASALGHAHGRGVIHRDIKPGNVMIEKSGRVLLTDFGIAKTYKQTGEVGDTLAGRKTALVGTPSYMAPEHVADEDVGPAVDVFALGAMLYGMLVGQSPFAGNGVVDVFRRIIDVKYQPLDERRPLTPPPIVNLINDCLVRDPRRRPTATDIVHTCEELFRAFRIRDPEPRVAELLELDRTIISDQFEIPAEFRTQSQPEAEVPGEKTVQSRPGLQVPAAGESNVEFEAPVPDLETTRIEAPAEPTILTPGPETTTQVQNPSRRALLERVVHAPNVVYGLAAALGLSALIIGIGLMARDDSGYGVVDLTPNQAASTPTPPPPEPESPKPIETIVEVTATESPEAPEPIPEVGSPAAPEATPDPKPASEARPHPRRRSSTLRGRAVIELKVIPWGKVFIDGAERGNAPVVRIVQLPAGKHTVTVHHPDLGTQKQTVTLKGGDRRTLRFDLTREP